MNKNLARILGRIVAHLIVAAIVLWLVKVVVGLASSIVAIVA